MGNTLETINRVDDDEEEDAKMNEIVSNESKSIELQPVYGKGNAKTGCKKDYDLYSESKIFTEVM